MVLATARSAGAMANSFLIVLLPIYIGTVVSIDNLVGIQIFGVSLQKEFYVGLILSIVGLVSGIFQPIGGRASDRLGRRKIFILLGILLLFVSTVSYPIVNSYALLLIFRVIQGIGIGMTVPSAVALVNEYSDQQDRGESFGVYNTLRLIGFGIGPVLSGLVYSQGPYVTPIGEFSGINMAFFVASVGALVSFFLVAVFVEDAVDKNTDSRSDNRRTSIRDKILSPRKLIPNDKQVLVLGLGTFLLASAISMFATLEAPVNERLNQGSFMFSLQFSLGILANVAFQIPVGRYSDRVGRKSLILAGFLILIPSMIAQAVVTSSLMMILARVSLGISVAFVFPTSLALVGDNAGDQSGGLLSYLTAGFSLGVAVGPLSSGFLYNLGSYGTPFYVGAVGAVIALVLSFYGLKKPKQ